MKTQPILLAGGAVVCGLALMFLIRSPQAAPERTNLTPLVLPSSPQKAKAAAVKPGQPKARLLAQAPAAERVGKPEGEPRLQPASAIPPALAQQRDDQLKSFLGAYGITGEATQSAVARYLGSVGATRQAVFESNRRLLQAVRNKAEEKELQGAVTAYEKAVQAYGQAREAGEKKLATELGEEWTPRTKALLLGMGAIGEPSPIVPPLWDTPPAAVATRPAAPPTRPHGVPSNNPHSG